MKKSTLLLAFACFYFLTYGQYEWAALGTEWYYDHYSTYNPDLNGYSYKIVDRDTILNGIDCRVLVEQRFKTNGSISTNESYTYESSDSIYYYDSDINDFKLYFIRNLEVGDTLELPNYENDIVKCIITENDYMSFDNVPLEFWELDYIIDTNYTSTCGIASFFIEGIGLINQFVFGCIYSYHFDSNLRCYFDDNINYQTVIDCDSIDLLDGIREYEYAEASIFPNPSSGSIAFTSENGVQMKNLTIFDSAGKLVLQRNTLSSRNQISIDHLNNGLYYFLIDINGKKQNGKFVLMKP